MRRIRNILITAFLGIAISLQGIAQDKNGETLKQEIRSAQTFRDRFPLYLNLLNQLPNGQLEKDNWCRRFLKDAKENNHENAIIRAGGHLSHSRDSVLIKDAIAEITRITRYGRIRQNVVLGLQCQLYNLRCQATDVTTRKRWLREILETLNAPQTDNLSSYDLFLLNYKAYITHTMLPNTPRPERFSLQMLELSMGMGIGNYNRPETMALTFVSEMCLLNSRYRSCLEYAQKILERVKQTDQSNGQSRNMSSNQAQTLYTIYNHMLIADFCLNQHINPTYFLQATELGRKYPWLMEQPMNETNYLPVFTAIHQGDMKLAHRLHQTHLDKAKKEQAYLFDYQYEMDNWLNLQENDLRHTLEMLEEQRNALVQRTDAMSQHFQNEDKLSYQWGLYQQEEMQLNMELDERQQAQLQNELALLQMKNIAKSNSIRRLKDLQTLEEDNLKIKLSKEKAEMELEESKYHREKLISYISIIVAIVLLVFFILIAVHNHLIKKANKKLQIKHAELRKIRDKADENNKLKILFLQNMSQEIRNPMTTIRNTCKMLTERVESTTQDKEMLECCKFVNNNSTQLYHMIDTILDINALESGKEPLVYSNVLIVPMLQDLVTFKKNTRNRDIRLVNDLPKEFTMNTDAPRFVQMAELLLNNACKFAPEGPIILHVWVKGETFHMTVEDKGPGIPPEKSEAVFRRFTKLNSFTTGAGLGLSLCRQIANALKGSLRVDNTYKEGARMVFKQYLSPDYVHKKSTLISILAAILMLTSPFMGAKAESIQEIQNRLEQSLQQTTDPEKRVVILRNLCDVTNSLSPEIWGKYTYMLVDAERAIHNETGIIMAARNICLLNTNESFKRALDIIKPLKESDEKKASIAFINCHRDQLAIKAMNGEQREQLVKKTIQELKEGGQKDLYEQYQLVHNICILSNEQNHTSLLEQYTREMIEICQQMKASNNFLVNQSIWNGIDICLQANDLQTCRKYCYMLLNNIKQLEAYYKSQNRPYRDFTLHKHHCYLCLSQCQEILSDAELKEVIQQMKDLVKTNPDILDNVVRRREHYLPILLNEGKWEEVKTYLDPILKYKERLTNAEESVVYPTSYNDYLFRSMIKTYSELKDTTRLIQSNQFYIDYKRRKLWNMTHNHFRHLSLYRNVLNAEKRITTLKLKNQHELALQCMQDEKEQSEREAIELDRKEKELREWELKKHNTELSEQKEQIELNRKKVDHEKQRSLYVGMLCILLSLLTLTFLQISNMLRIRKKRKDLVKAERVLNLSIYMANKTSEERTAFVQNLSHELRTPMNAIIGFSQHLIEGNRNIDAEKMEAYSTLINENCELMTTLIDDIIDLSLLESGQYNMKLESCHPTEIINTCLTNVQEKVQKDVNLQFINHISAEQTIISDRTRLEQLIMNLLTNACKYCSKGNIRIIQSLTDDKKQIQIVVEDTGIGIKPEYAERIFKRTEKNDSKLLGAGLGLHICRLIATRLQAKVYLDTTYTDGARFVLKHPIEQNSITQ